MPKPLQITSFCISFQLVLSIILLDKTIIASTQGKMAWLCGCVYVSWRLYTKMVYPTANGHTSHY